MTVDQLVLVRVGTLRLVPPPPTVEPTVEPCSPPSSPAWQRVVPTVKRGFTAEMRKALVRQSLAVLWPPDQSYDVYKTQCDDPTATRRDEFHRLDNSGRLRPIWDKFKRDSDQASLLQALVGLANTLTTESRAKRAAAAAATTAAATAAAAPGSSSSSEESNKVEKYRCISRF